MSLCPPSPFFKIFY